MILWASVSCYRQRSHRLVDFALPGFALFVMVCTGARASLLCTSGHDSGSQRISSFTSDHAPPVAGTFIMPGQEGGNTSSIESRRGAVPVRKIGTRQYDSDGTGPWGG